MLTRNKYGLYSTWKASQESRNITVFKEKIGSATVQPIKEETHQRKVPPEIQHLPIESVVPKDYIPLIEIEIEGRMPPLMTHSILTGTVIPLVQDESVGMAGPLTLKYLGKTTFGNVRCLTFQGWCPIHKRQHDSAKFQLQKNSKGECWWKCFRDGSNKWIPFGVNTI